jgi:hypothetical protein
LKGGAVAGESLLFGSLEQAQQVRASSSTERSMPLMPLMQEMRRPMIGAA